MIRVSCALLASTPTAQKQKTKKKKTKNPRFIQALAQRRHEALWSHAALQDLITRLLLFLVPFLVPLWEEVCTA